MPQRILLDQGDPHGTSQAILSLCHGEPWEGPVHVQWAPLGTSESQACLVAVQGCFPTRPHHRLPPLPPSSLLTTTPCWGPGRLRDICHSTFGVRFLEAVKPGSAGSPADGAHVCTGVCVWVYGEACVCPVCVYMGSACAHGVCVYTHGEGCVCMWGCVCTGGVQTCMGQGRGGVCLGVCPWGEVEGATATEHFHMNQNHGLGPVPPWLQLALRGRIQGYKR